LPLGTLTVSGQKTCTGGRGCQISFEVDCPDVEAPAQGTFFESAPSGNPRGLVMILVGGRGLGFEGVNRSFVQTLNLDGFETVVLSWVDSWLEASSGEMVGPKRLACRAATAIKWVHDNLYEQLGAPAPALGACGFCLHGNSGGATQTAYALSFYGLGSVVDAAVVSGGPPHAALAKGCLDEPGYAYDTISARIIDASYGFLDGGGPCERRDASFTHRWEQDSIDVGGQYEFESTRIAFIFVEGDPTPGPDHGKVWEAKLKAAHSPHMSEEIIPGTEHTIELLPNGREALEKALQASV
jgi:hypothetical protein